MFDPTELNRVQTLCREIYRTNGEGRAVASSIDYNRNQFSEDQVAGSTACRRLARAIYVVLPRRVDPGPLTVGKSREYRRKRCNSILCKPVNRSRGNGEETGSHRHWR